MMEPQLPMLRAFCTEWVLMLAVSLIRTKRVPIMLKMIPMPAISMGRRIGGHPAEIIIGDGFPDPSTIVASTVAT